MGLHVSRLLPHLQAITYFPLYTVLMLLLLTSLVAFSYQRVLQIEIYILINEIFSYCINYIKFQFNETTRKNRIIITKIFSCYISVQFRRIRVGSMRIKIYKLLMLNLCNCTDENVFF
jgi:hypothetical protein